MLPSRIIYRREWIRLLASTVIHADDMHLYYNMISFLWKVRIFDLLKFLSDMQILALFYLVCGLYLFGSQGCLFCLFDSIVNVHTLTFRGGVWSHF